MKGWLSSMSIFFSSLMCSTCLRLMIWLLESCFRANTSFDGLITCLTLPKVPAPKVWTTSYLDISLGYFKLLAATFLDFDRSVSCLFEGADSYLSRYFCSFSSLFNKILNCSVFIISLLDFFIIIFKWVVIIFNITYHLLANVNLLSFFKFPPSRKSPRSSHMLCSFSYPVTTSSYSPYFILLLKILSIVSLNMSSTILGSNIFSNGLAYSIAGFVFT